LGIYLTLVGLSALLIGGVGVANAIKSYLDRRVATIATLKCVGASNGLVFAVYLIQVLALAAIGIGAGLVLGALFPFLAAPLLATFMPTEIQVGLHGGALLLAAAFGLLTTLVFAAWPLLSAAAVPPRVLFRAVVAPVESHMGWRARAIIAVLILALTALAVLAVGDVRLGFWFAVGALVAFGAFRLAGAGLARLAAAVSHRRHLTAGRPALRLGLGNMHRPGAALPSVVLSLGIGLTVLVAVALVEANMARQVKETMPADAPAFFFIDIQPNQVAAFEETVRAVPGAGAIQRVPHLRGRIVKLNGVAPEDAKIAREAEWVVRGDRGITYSATPPEGATIVAGEWCPADYKGPPLVSFDADAAAGLGLKVGDTLTINVLGREIEARIANLRRIEWTTLGLNFTVILSPGVLEKAPQTHVAAVMAAPSAELPIERAVADRFTNISAVRVKAALEALTDILNRVATALDAAALVTLAAGLLVLASAVAAGQERRIYDSVVLKVLGATRRDVLTAYAVEFGLVGLATALVAAVLGVAAAYGVLGRVMRADWVLTPGSLALALVPALLPALAATLVAGAAGSVLALRRKPAPLLRNE
jgi:putative ABC transport system permease protein